MRAVAFVPVRLTSTRLPEKHLKFIGDRTLFSWVISRLKACRNLDEIVVCVPDEPESEKLKPLCDKEGVELFIYEGDVNDVVGRLTTAAKRYNADICVLASGDCPLLSPSTIDMLVGFLKEHPDVDIAYIEPLDRKPPIHEGISVARRHVWELADRYSDTPELREHQFPVLGVYPEKFAHLKRAGLRDKEIFYRLKHRISVDTPRDLEFMNECYRRLKEKGKEFTLENVIELLQENPDLMKINAHVHQKGLHEKSYKVLFVVSAVGDYGYGNLVRSLEIADRLVSMGVGVRFLVFDHGAKRMCEERAFHAEIIGELSELASKAASYHMVIFDLNRDIALEEGLVERVKEYGKVVVIDNTSPGALKADLVIVPTAHYTGEDRDNLIWGPEYVVVSSHVMKAKNKNIPKRDVVLARVDEEYADCVELLWKKVEFVRGFGGDFAERIKGARLCVFHLGLSCYEALYLGTPVEIIPRTPEELPEIEAFYRFAHSGAICRLSDGAMKIAEKLVSLLSAC